MNHFFKFLLFPTLLLSSRLAAIPSPEPGGWSFGAEYLYWHPLYEQSFYTINGPNTSDGFDVSSLSGRRVHNPMKWASGFKVEGIYGISQSGNELDLRWTHVNNRYQSSVNHPAGGDLAAPTTGQPNFVIVLTNEASDNTRFNFDEVEFMFWKIPLSTGNYFAFRGGLNYSHVWFKRNTTYTRTSIVPTEFSHIVQRNSYWGLGPEIALDFYYPLSYLFFSGTFAWPISLHGDFRTALLVSKSKASYLEQDAYVPSGLPTTTLNVVNDPIWRLVPMFDLRLGLNYNRTCRCFNLNFELGYEFLSYNRAIQSIVFYGAGSIEDNPFASFDQYANLDFHGPYVALGFSF